MKKRVSKKEFEKFIKEYPKPLDRFVVTMVEPCCIVYNDYSDGRTYPETSIVAKTWLYSDNPDDDHTYEPEDKREYYIECEDDLNDRRNTAKSE